MIGWERSPTGELRRLTQLTVGFFARRVVVFGFLFALPFFRFLCCVVCFFLGFFRPYHSQSTVGLFGFFTRLFFFLGGRGSIRFVRLFLFFVVFFWCFSALSTIPFGALVLGKDWGLAFDCFVRGSCLDFLSSEGVGGMWFMVYGCCFAGSYM